MKGTCRACSQWAPLAEDTAICQPCTEQLTYFEICLLRRLGAIADAVEHIAADMPYKS